MGEPRVIKFRVWVIGGKAQEPYMETFTLQEMFEDKINSRWIERNKLRIMQFTGLTDRQGKEIYEGDIVAFTDKPLVERSHEHGGPKKPRIIKWKGNGYNLRRIKNSVAMGVEIIGNIYEPPKPSPLKEKE